MRSMSVIMQFSDEFTIFKVTFLACAARVYLFVAENQERGSSILVMSMSDSEIPEILNLRSNIDAD